jgi:hypothetical protein
VHESDKVASATQGFAPLVQPITTGLSDSSFSLAVSEIVPYSTFQLLSGFLHSEPERSELDLRSAAALLVRVCQHNPERRRDSTADACLSTESQVNGAVVSIDSGNRVYYPSNTSEIDPSALKTRNGLALFVNVPPGLRHIELAASDVYTQQLVCTTDTGAGFSTGQQLSISNTFELAVVPGFFNGVSIFCELTTLSK